jgi:hypothetical protein
MATADSVRTSIAFGPQFSPALTPSARRDGLADPDETSPLLGTNSARALQPSHSERWHFLSAFFDKNAGLSLLIASQFFFSAMNVCVKWLNSLDEPVPILEVRIGSRMVVFPELTSSRVVDLGQNGKTPEVLLCVQTLKVVPRP